MLYENQKEYCQAPLAQKTTKQVGSSSFLVSSWFDTPLGPMLAIADKQYLHLLEFIECRGLEREIKCLQEKSKAVIVPGRTPIIDMIEDELQQYFAGMLKTFTTPIALAGTPFQQQVWRTLQAIPYGQTWSYKELACAINKPTAFRAVANANGANQLALIVPCHRVINANNKLGGYGGGIEHKRWLLEHESRIGR